MFFCPILQKIIITIIFNALHHKIIYDKRVVRMHNLSLLASAFISASCCSYVLMVTGVLAYVVDQSNLFDDLIRFHASVPLTMILLVAPHAAPIASS